MYVFLFWRIEVYACGTNHQCTYMSPASSTVLIAYPRQA